MVFAHIAVLLVLTGPLVFAQLSGPVGPTTSSLAKQSKMCNVLDYGGTINSSDIGPAISSAYGNCVKKNPGSTLYVPPGNYNMSTWAVLRGGVKWAFQMDGIITRAGLRGGHMILIRDAVDFEMYSSTSAGAFQGLGYLSRWRGPRFLRIVTSTNWSLHDLIFVDSPTFHVIVEGGSNGEIYNLVIRGAAIGATDGIDISGTNHWVHDVEVSNGDECVTTKASHFLIERIWCNRSGGSAIGSLPGIISISNILYRNVYTNGGNQMFMMKSNGGRGSVQNVMFQNFIGRGSAYGLNINQYWGPLRDGDGVLFHNITFDNWTGEVVNGMQRPPINILCADSVPCTNIVLKDVNLWSASGSASNRCRSAYGSGACLKSGSGTSGNYSAVTTKITKPPGYVTPAGMPGDLAKGWAKDSYIPIPPSIPNSFFPGLPQISPLAKNKAKMP